MFALALIFAFAFFERAGAAGALLFGGFEFLIGKIVFLLPLFLVVAGLIFLGMKRQSLAPVLFALLLVTTSAAGVAGGIAKNNALDIQEMAGWIGFIVATPLFAAFGFWVTEIILFALVIVAAIIFWQLLPHEKKEEGLKRLDKIIPTHLCVIVRHR